MSQQAECSIFIPEVAGLEANKLTVGRHIELNCKTEAATLLDFAKVDIKSEQKITIKLFKAESINAQNFKLKLTFYKTGNIQISDYILTDGVNEISLVSQPLQFESVIEQPAGGKPPEAYGPLFPLPIVTPTLYYAIIIGALLIIGVMASLRARKMAYYKKLRESLYPFQSAIDPETQFYKAIRSAEKKNYPLSEIEAAIKLYMLRSYQVPIFVLKRDEAVNYLKRMFPEYKEARLQIKKILIELEDLNKKEATLSFDERAELVKKLYRFVDKNKGMNL